MKLNINKYFWSILVICLSIAWILHKNPQYNESFTQDEDFITKYNDEIYDDFYCEIYDEIHPPQRRSENILSIIKMTEPDSKSVMLDIGSGTGYLVNYLKKAGYNIYGIDKSQSMVDYAKATYDVPVMQGNIEDPTTFEKKTFSHILCIYYTIYHFQDKLLFFRNCHQWLKTGGYLFLHLMEGNVFNQISPDFKYQYLNFTPHKNEKDFTDFVYTNKMDRSRENVVFNEKFKDKFSLKIRENEQTFYMNDILNILGIAQHCGFQAKGKITIEENQYYILESIM